MHGSVELISKEFLSSVTGINDTFVEQTFQEGDVFRVKWFKYRILKKRPEGFICERVEAEEDENG